MAEKFLSYVSYKKKLKEISAMAMHPFSVAERQQEDEAADRNTRIRFPSPAPFQKLKSENENENN